MSNKLVKSPLRYPGGKSRAVKHILPLIPPDVKSVCSPFFGGGSIELACVSKGIKVYGYDLFDPLANFWQCIINNPKRLSDQIQQYHPISKKEFYRLQKDKVKPNTKYNRAAVFYVLNRSSFCGSTLSGGMSPNHPRFNQASIDRVRNFKISNLSVECVSFQKSIRKHKNCFLYLDPPYIIESMLYGNKGSTHKGFDHQKLCDILKNRDRWILSYNNCDEVKNMYKDYKFEYPEWNYGMSKDKKSKEILIFSKDLN